MRHLVASLGGLLLVGVLFVLLALLVAPPQRTPTLETPSVSLAMVEAPSQQSASAPPRPAAPAPAAAPPPPPPAPAPRAQSPITLPEPELPAPPQESPPMDMALPPLEEQAPEPDPTPEPAPEPVQATLPAETAAESTAAESTAAESTAAESTAANGEAASSEATAAETTSQQEVSAAPRPTRRVPPEYPSRAQRRGLEGHVVVAFTIRPDGEVDRGSITVVEADPARVFDRAAARAIAGWEFPAAGAPRRVRQRLEFQLR